MLKLSVVGLMASFTVLSGKVIAASFGELVDSSIQSRATVCLNIGAMASLTGLDNIQLAAVSTDGEAGSVYLGEDAFHLESNAPVRVMIENGQLTNGEYSINAVYQIDSIDGFFQTTGDAGHKADHTLSARVQLGRVSQQIAGDYSGNITLTVVPETGSEGCGQSTSSFRSEDGWMTLAFEDLYPNVGDGDYNDMVVRYHIEESYNARQELESVSLEFDPLARGAGYNHALYLSLDGIIEKSKNITTFTQEAFAGDALIDVTYTRDDGNSRTFYNYDKEDNISIFSNTRAVMDGQSYANVFTDQEWTEAKYKTSININLANPELNLLEDRSYNSLFNYRPFLYVMNTNSDIDLAIINQQDGMISAEGDPFGLVIPGSWEWPLEGVSLETAYPYYPDYKAWLNGDVSELSAQAEYWYKYPASGDLIYNL